MSNFYPTYEKNGHGCMVNVLAQRFIESCKRYKKYLYMVS
jgi:hypothetical protein